MQNGTKNLRIFDFFTTRGAPLSSKLFFLNKNKLFFLKFPLKKCPSRDILNTIILPPLFRKKIITMKLGKNRSVDHPPMEKFRLKSTTSKSLINNSLHSTTLPPNIYLNKINPKKFYISWTTPFVRKSHLQNSQKATSMWRKPLYNQREFADEIDNRFPDTVRGKF